MPSPSKENAPVVQEKLSVCFEKCKTQCPGVQAMWMCLFMCQKKNIK